MPTISCIVVDEMVGTLRFAHPTQLHHALALPPANGAAAYTTLPPTIVSTDLILPISFTGAVM